MVKIGDRMEIVLITGMSGAGKTAIAKKLCEKNIDKYNFVNSYTDRKKRTKDEWGHIFVNSKEMDNILTNKDIVAQTKIDKNRYCATIDQFSENQINIYIVDVNGINNIIKAFPKAKIMSILVRRKDVEVDCVRINRDVNIPARDDVDFLIDNDGTIDSAANLLDTFVNFDFFSLNHSSTVLDLQDKIDYIDMQYRFLDDIKESLYEQMWYSRLPVYKKLCKYVEKKINEEFDFKITINPDTSPEIIDGYLTYNLQGEHDNGDIMWDEMNRLVERMSHYAYEFGKDDRCDDIIYRLAVSERWIGEDKYE